MKKLCELPKDWHRVSSGKRPSHAVELLMEQLGKMLGTHYQRISEPDKSERHRPAADFIYKEDGSGKLVAVEYTEFTNPKVAEASALMGRGKPLRRQGPDEVRPWEVEGEQIGFTEPTRSYPEDFAVLDKFIADKIKKGQLQNTRADERILLIFDRTLVAENSFRRYECNLPVTERDDVDHAFIIVDQRAVLQVW